MHEAAARNLRTAERYLLEPPLTAQFGASSVAVCDISAKGARIKHGQPVEMGQKSLLKLAIDGRPAPVQLEAVVMWTQSQIGPQDKFVSGVRTYGSPEVMTSILSHLYTSKRSSRIEEMRGADRFNVTPAIDATWEGRNIRIENLAARGARFEAGEEMEPETAGTLRFAIPGHAMAVEIAGKVVWSALKSVTPRMFRTGLTITEKPEIMRLAIGQLCEVGRAALDTHSLGLKLKIIRARARQLAPSYRAIEAAGVPAEQYLLIQCVREELRLNPDEAMHWYRRARITIADPSTRAAAPAIANHPDALAVWEYLDRSIDPSVIGRTFELPDVAH
jgi:hypothetical protein